MIYFIFKENEIKMNLEQLRQVYYTHLDSIGYQDRKVASLKTQQGIAYGQTLFNEKNWEKVLDMWMKEPHRVWIWSDLHLFHKNIITYENRPFENPEQMNQFLYEQAQCVPPDDIVLMLGDISMGNFQPTLKWVKEIPGQKYLILGNHDVDRTEKLNKLSDFPYQGISDCFLLPYHLSDLLLTHYPFSQEDLPSHSINIHGHTHSVQFSGNFINVSVENHHYRPQKLMNLLEQHQK